MCRRDQVDVMATEFLEMYHDIRKVFILNFLAIAFMGDGPVLAENTAKIK